MQMSFGSRESLPSAKSGTDGPRILVRILPQLAHQFGITEKADTNSTLLDFKWVYCAQILHIRFPWTGKSIFGCGVRLRIEQFA